MSIHYILKKNTKMKFALHSAFVLQLQLKCMGRVSKSFHFENKGNHIKNGNLNQEPSYINTYTPNRRELNLHTPAGGRKTFSLPRNSPANEKLSYLAKESCHHPKFFKIVSPSFYLSFIKGSSFLLFSRLAYGLP